jgi:hypothetical protein
LNFRHGFKAEAKRIAARVRDKVGLTPICPIDPVEVCARFDIRLLKLSEVEPDSPFLHGENRKFFSAVTVPRGGRTAILHNDKHHEHRQRSNICHELAHCFLGHGFTPPLTIDGERTHDRGIEAEADFLAGVLLLTDEGAMHVLRRRLTDEAQHLYGVSEQMLQLRLNMSGAYIRMRRAAVYS